MTAVLMRKTLGGKLEPTDDAGQRVLSRLKAGAIVRVDVVRPRNVQHHRKLFAMLNLILANQDHYKSLDDLLDVCKLRIGHVRVIQTRMGEVRLPKSISFAEMGQAEFEDFYERAVTWLCSEVIPGLKRGDLDREVEAELMEFAA